VSQEPPFSPTSSDTCESNNPPPQDFTPVDPLVQKLRFELSHVKNQRLCPHSSPYEYMRHLSVLRFIEWTLDGDKSESDAAHDVAALLWEHKSDHPDSSINHKATLIRKWAKEYRKDGKLCINAQGQHAKTMSTLADENIAKAAQKELAKMSNPGPGPLRTALSEKIFPKFGIKDPIPTENTCRNYMEKWGWKTGGYRQWIPVRKKLLDVGDDDSDDGNVASDETSILETKVSIQRTPPAIKTPSWNAPIPSPTSAILSSSSTQPAIMSQVTESFVELNSPLNVSSPVTAFTDTTMPMSDRMTAPWTNWPQYGFVQPAYQSQMYPFQMQSTYPTNPQLQAQTGLQYHEQAQRRYAPKSLDNLIPDLPQMRGHRPAFNGLPVTTFIPQTSQTTPLEPFHHDTTFPSNISRQSTNNQPNPTYNDPSSHQYLPH
jgi:hypothetical protein